MHPCPVCHDKEGQTHPTGPTSPCPDCSVAGWALVNAGPAAFDTWDGSDEQRRWGENVGCLPMLVWVVAFWAGFTMLALRLIR